MTPLLARVPVGYASCVMALATLFDFNGVLVDDEHVHLEAFRRVVAPLGIALTDEAYEASYIGFDDVGAFRAMLDDHGLDASPDRVRALVEEKKPVYLAMARAGALKAFEGAADLVRGRAERGVVGVVSGALRHEIELGLELLGVRDHVAFIVSAEDTAACKPDPEGYLLGVRAMREKGHAGPIAALEDSTAGVRAAKAAGLRCVAVLHSSPELALREAGADAIARTIREVSHAMLDGVDR